MADNRIDQFADDMFDEDEDVAMPKPPSARRDVGGAKPTVANPGHGKPVTESLDFFDEADEEFAMTHTPPKRSRPQRRFDDDVEADYDALDAADAALEGPAEADRRDGVPTRPRGRDGRRPGVPARRAPEPEPLPSGRGGYAGRGRGEAPGGPAGAGHDSLPADIGLDEDDVDLGGNGRMAEPRIKQRYDEDGYPTGPARPVTGPDGGVVGGGAADFSEQSSELPAGHRYEDDDDDTPGATPRGGSAVPDDADEDGGKRAESTGGINYQGDWHEWEKIPYGSKRFETQHDLNEVLNDAVDMGASDIHIGTDKIIRARISKQMVPMRQYQTADEDTMQDILFGMLKEVVKDDLRRKRSADSSYDILIGRGKGRHFRGHYGKDRNGWYMVFRFINPRIFNPDEIGLPKEVVAWSQLAKGLVLVTGSTNSGKSVSLASILRQAQLTRHDHIVTLESPIEAIFPDDCPNALVNQREIPTDAQSFLSGIEDAMREDPNIILVGEIRDKATAEAAIDASNTGHLTFATIHASSSSLTIDRILAMFDGDERKRIQSALADNFSGAMYQCLMPRADGHGLIAAREILHMDEHTKELIAAGDVPGLSRMMDERHESMDYQLIRLIVSGTVTLEVARRNSGNRPKFDEVLLKMLQHDPSLLKNVKRDKTAADSLIDPRLITYIESGGKTTGEDEDKGKAGKHLTMTKAPAEKDGGLPAALPDDGSRKPAATPPRPSAGRPRNRSGNHRMPQHRR